MTLVCEFCEKVYKIKYWYDQHIEKHLSKIIYDALEIVLPPKVFIVENDDYERMKKLLVENDWDVDYAISLWSDRVCEEQYAKYQLAKDQHEDEKINKLVNDATKFLYDNNYCVQTFRTNIVDGQMEITFLLK